MATPHDYCNALAELNEASADLKHLGAQLQSFTARMLAFPEETCFVDIEGEPQPTLDQLMTVARWYAPEFPTPERLQAALRRRFVARQKALQTWEELTPQQRDGAPRVLA